MTRVGFVGLGSQGGPMALRIAEAGHPTTLWARRPESLEPFAESGAAVAAEADEPHPGHASCSWIIAWM